MLELFNVFPVAHELERNIYRARALQFRVLYLQGIVTLFISSSSGGSPDPI